LKASYFKAGEGHGGGETATLGVADDATAGTPGDYGHAVEGYPATDAKTDKRPGFSPTKERGRKIGFHFEIKLSRCQAKSCFSSRIKDIRNALGRFLTTSPAGHRWFGSQFRL
jgi:hypothetical protein